MTGPDPILELDGIRVIYGDRTVIDGFSAELAADARCALMGRSGSGKTTLLLVMAGLLRPAAGRVTSRLLATEVVYVPQAPSLVAELTVAQNASLGLRIRGAAPHDALERGRHALDSLGLTGIQDALPAQLSGGMQQRVALARAMAIEPRLMLVDEPTGSLDRSTGDIVLAALLRQAELTRAALVVATHDPEVAARFGQRLSTEQEAHR